MRRLSFFLCYQRVPMDNAAFADDNDATLHSVLFDFEMSPCQSCVRQLGHERLDFSRVSSRVVFERSGIGSGRVFHNP